MLRHAVLSVLGSRLGCLEHAPLTLLPARFPFRIQDFSVFRLTVRLEIAINMQYKLPGIFRPRPRLAGLCGQLSFLILGNFTILV